VVVQVEEARCPWWRDSASKHRADSKGVFLRQAWLVVSAPGSLGLAAPRLFDRWPSERPVRKVLGAVEGAATQFVFAAIFLLQRRPAVLPLGVATGAVEATANQFVHATPCGFILCPIRNFTFRAGVDATNTLMLATPGLLRIRPSCLPLVKALLAIVFASNLFVDAAPLLLGAGPASLPVLDARNAIEVSVQIFPQRAAHLHQHLRLSAGVSCAAVW